MTWEDLPTPYSIFEMDDSATLATEERAASALRDLFLLKVVNKHVYYTSENYKDR